MVELAALAESLMITTLPVNTSCHVQAVISVQYNNYFLPSIFSHRYYVRKSNMQHLEFTAISQRSYL